MSWILNQSSVNTARGLRQLLEEDAFIQAPGVFNTLSGLLAKKKGFKSLYVSGASFSASMGLPDLGYFNLSDITSYVDSLYKATQLPIIVDVDTGFGEVLHLPYTVMQLETSGAAAIQIEDQQLPKKCGHLEGKRLVSTSDMCRKIEAAVKTRKDLLIIARTDAHSLFGIEEAISRAKSYVNAGADVIFPEALKTEEELQKFSQEIKVPLLANMTEFGKTPYFTASDFLKWGYKIIIYPVSSLRVAMKSVEDLFDVLLEEESQEKVVHKMQTRKELYDLIDYDSYGEFDQNVANSNKYIN